MRFIHKITKNLRPEFLLVLLILFHFIGNIIWLSLNNAPPGWDEAAHTKGAAEYALFFSEALKGNINFDLLRIPLHDPYFPIAKIIASLLLILIYPSVKVAQFTGTLFFLGSILFMYLVAKKVAHSSWIALLSTIILSFAPHLLDRSRTLSLDIAVLFFYIGAFYYFIVSNYFEQKKETLLFFLFFSLAILTKFQSVVYFIPLGLYLILYYVKRGISKNTILNMGIGIVISLILIIPVLLFNLDSLSLYLSIAPKGYQSTTSLNLLNLDTWLYYPKQIILGFFPLIYIPILFIGMLFFLRSHFRYKTFLLIQSLGIWFILSLIENKGVRFFLPVLPCLIIISTIGLSELLNRYTQVKIAIFFYILTWGLVANLTLSFGLFPSIKPIFFLNENYSIIHPYFSQKYPFEEMVDDFVRYINPQNKTTDVLFIPNFADFNLNSINMYLRIKYINTITASTFPSNELLQHYFQDKPIDIEKELSQYSYVVYSESDFGSPWLIDLQNNNDIQTLLQERIKNSVLDKKTSILSTYALPSGQIIHLAKIN